MVRRARRPGHEASSAAVSLLPGGRVAPDAPRAKDEMLLVVQQGSQGLDQRPGDAHGPLARHADGYADVTAFAGGTAVTRYWLLAYRLQATCVLSEVMLR